MVYITSMVDRVARTLARASTGEAWDELTPALQGLHVHMACQALRCMREPSAELMAFFKVGGGWTADTEIGARIGAEMVAQFEREWREMIDVLSGDYMARLPETQNPAKTAG